jgi:hypothetical protein
MKKKVLQSLLGLFMVSFIGQNSDNSLYAQCEITSTAPTINTTIESVWSSATTHAITLPLTSTSTPAGFSAQWRSLYTATNLYFLIEVTKTGTLYNQNGSTWWDDDAVEIYLDGNHSAGGTYDGANDYQFGFRYNDGAVVKTGSFNPSNSTTGITYNFYTTSAGYNVEILIPWTTLNTTPVAGNQVGIEIGVDVSNGTRMTQMTTYNNSGQSFNNPSLFGSITLNACVTAINNPDTEISSLNTSPNPYSNQTTLSLPSIGSYNIVVTDLKGRMVKEYSVTNDDKAILTSEGMENGMYVYSVKSLSTNNMYNGKLIVNK